MKHLFIYLFGMHRFAGAATPTTARPSAGRRAGMDRLSRLWSAIARPFYRSIYVRFQYAFGLAILGLLLMAAITVVSGRVLMNTYENSVSEARFELMPAHDIQASLREAEHLTYLYAIEGNQSAPFRFKVVEETVYREFRQLIESTSRFASVEHAHSSISVSESVTAWKEAQAAALAVFRFAAGTPEAVEALRRAHAKIDPVYDTISKFHRGSMQDLQDRLKFARSVADQTYSAIFGAIMIGLGVLIAAGFFVGGSVLQPIEELQRVARRLGEKDFSQRVRLRNTRDELGQLGRAFNIATATLQRLYGELEQRSTHDGLTGALNRAAFDERLSAECMSADRHKRSMSLLMVDIDFFKRVNDTHGHQTGDHVLQTLVELLNETIRPGDILARYGGEEFIIILPEADENGAMAMAERVRSTVERHVFNCPIGNNIGVTVSVGCANRLTAGMASDDLVKAADAALYRAKKTGRNRVVSASELAPAHRSGARKAAA
ncbi:MAG: diguanylate cyclase [Pseudolabrys sp.]|nr:diguanylate cyclase [Pseudolabrys sp.]